MHINHFHIDLASYICKVYFLFVLVHTMSLTDLATRVVDWSTDNIISCSVGHTKGEDSVTLKIAVAD